MPTSCWPRLQGLKRGRTLRGESTRASSTLTSFNFRQPQPSPSPRSTLPRSKPELTNVKKEIQELTILSQRSHLLLNSYNSLGSPLLTTDYLLFGTAHPVHHHVRQRHSLAHLVGRQEHARLGTGRPRDQNTHPGTGTCSPPP